ncbi:hypothetical protein SMI01S_11760 [Sphingobacterium mizutaii NBRC 14946 = DSM 11724]|uniref:Terminase-like family protein n=3 Tax=Sphingobacterium mizutaii TaxID=1010 RepID=A0AAJ4XDJ1_9SPHI|nr:hypothetical protein SMI01S_11760 [Sphingobacterium mizutaii NBRC 14946 = DSM 11724]SDL14423.1 hypothetical protein SAMN05192578_1011510 [Sphingobacterium mizutaii]SNV52139.1 Uncharacterised protein [Sphingobacterium mizutaii]
MAGQRVGKSHMIGFKSGYYVKNFPKMRGMIAANTYKQLSQSTLVAVRKVWKQEFGITEYDRTRNPSGVYVVNKKPPAHFTINEAYDRYDGIVSFRNGAIIYIASLDNYEAHDGKELGWAELDETKDTKEEALTSVILGRMSQPGLFVNELGELVYLEEGTDEFEPFNPVCINTSPAVATPEWLIDMFNLHKYDAEILEKITAFPDFFYKEIDGKAIVIYSTHHNAHNLPRNYIQNRLKTLTKGDALKFVYGYPFSQTGGEFYDEFDRLRHVLSVPFVENKPVHLSFDFNVLPYMTMLCAQVETLTKWVDSEHRYFDNFSEGHRLVQVMEIRFFKEYCLKSPQNDVKGVVTQFKADYSGKVNTVFYYGDGSGHNRVPGKGEYRIYDDVEFELHGLIFNASDRTMRRNPSVLKRRKFIQEILKGGIHHVIIRVDSVGCPELIKDFQYLKLGSDGKLKEVVKDPVTKQTYQKYGHTTDAMEYLICELCDKLFDA